MTDLERLAKLHEDLGAVIESMKRKEREAKRVTHNANAGFIIQDGLTTRPATDKEVIQHFRFKP